MTKENFPEPHEAKDSFIIDSLIESSATDKELRKSALKDFYAAGGNIIEGPGIKKGPEISKHTSLPRRIEIHDAETSGTERGERVPGREEVFDIIKSIATQDGIKPEELRVARLSQTGQGTLLHYAIEAEAEIVRQKGWKRCEYVYAAKGYKDNTAFSIDRVLFAESDSGSSSKIDHVATYEDGKWNTSPKAWAENTDTKNLGDSDAAS